MDAGVGLVEHGELQSVSRAGFIRLFPIVFNPSDH
jgi:hypothetical protein